MIRKYTPSVWRSARNAKIIERRREGRTYEAIAIEFHLTTVAVHAIVNGRADRRRREACAPAT